MSIDLFSSARDMLDALASKEISSTELTEMHIDQIEARDGELNAIPVPTFERARDSARAADEKLAGGESAALLGLPMTLKESTQTAGLPQTAGLEPFKGYSPTEDGVVASAIFDAGANLLGKTNIPVALGDWQADSPVYGRTHNPWDTTRTPGGSTGGGGAALAAGMTPLEIGSDIGGSIRVPAAYCGAYGHRPSETAIPRSGSFPLADLPNPAFLMGVQGPLARTSRDLELLFDVVAGPDLFEDVAWRLHLPESRAEKLEDFRIAVMPEIPGARASSVMKSRVDELAAMLSNEGAKVEVTQPEIDLEQYYLDYVRTLNCMVSQGQPREQLLAQAAELRKSDDATSQAMADGLSMLAIEYLGVVTRRQASLVAWQRFFTDWDVWIGPQTLDSAFPHQTGGLLDRKLIVDDEEVPYFSNIIYSMLAIFCGLPSTAFPAGQDQGGLPLGLQAVGPYLEDRTTLRFAQLVEDRWFSFEKPPGF
jgi:amidase